MACPSDIQAQIDALTADLAAVRAAILAIASGGQSYQLNTGQTQQMVTKASLNQLRIYSNELQNQIQMLKAECCGGGATHVVPGW